MDKKSLIGLLLVGALLIGYSIFTRPSREQLEEAARKRDSVALVEAQRKMEAMDERKQADSLKSTEQALTAEEVLDAQMRELGSFADAAIGKDTLYYLENQKIKLAISTRGGRVYSAELKEYQTWDDKPVVLFDGDSTEFNLHFFSQNKSIATQNLYFVPQGPTSHLVAEESPKSLTMRLNAGDGRFIDYIYTLNPDSFELGYKIRLSGMDKIIGRSSPVVDLNWSYPLKPQEKSYKSENLYSTIYYKFFQDDVEHLSSRKGSGEADLTTRVEWIGFKQQFFSTVFRAKDAMVNARVTLTDLPEESGYLKYCHAEMSLPFEGKSDEEIDLSFYFLPNHYKTLKEIGHDYSELIDLGWPFISWINKWFVINIFHSLESVIGNYGIIIIILTIFFKLLVFPLSYRSGVSGAKMRVLKPQVDELTKKFSKDKAMEKQQATMALYKKAGVNPMGGCLPALLQMPIWLALFRFFPASIELRQQSFLWATDLSSYDSIINLPFTIPAYGDHISLFTLLMAISMMVTTKINMDQTATTQPMPGMKVMMYIMPVMMLVWFNSYASGLTFYYFVSNLISYVQQLIIKRNINEETVLAKLNQNQKKPVKKSRFQARLEEMQKQRGITPPKKR